MVMRNVENATIKSPCYRDGIGTVYFDAVNGWVTELLDHFPEKGETVEFERISMTVMGVKQMCAERVEVSLKPEEEDE